MVGSYWNAIGFGMGAIFVFLLVGTGILPCALAEGLQRSFPVKDPAEAAFGRAVYIIILVEPTAIDPHTRVLSSSWVSGSRIVMGAALHRAALAAGARSTIIVAGERIRSSSEENPDCCARMLRALGVPDSDLIQEKEGMNTFEHAKNISDILRPAAAEAIYLVTSALHMRRAILYFGAFGLGPIPFPSDYISGQRLFLPVGYNFAVADIALHQYLGIIRFYIYQKLGLNRRSSASR